jgi:Acyclic terpene utilisation family protein AtuA
MSLEIQPELEDQALAKAVSVGVVVPSGMLGSGFSAESVGRGLELGASAIAIDAGSTDSGPHYLGAGVSKNTAAAVKRDLRILLLAAREAQIPLIVGSCGTSGTDGGVDWTAQIAQEIAQEERLEFTLARIYSEQSPDALTRALAAGRIAPLTPAGPLDETTLRSCEHIVGAMGHEPILAALEHGADAVLAGRASDTSLVAAVALMNGLPPGPAWHAAKTVECGDQCTTSPRGGGVYVEIDAEGFTVSPLDPQTACTPISVAAHMLYENANPFRLTEPCGVLDTSDARYASADGRTVRVTGSRFLTSSQATIKLEGSRRAGSETMSFVGIADPEVLADIDAWTEALQTRIENRARDLLALEPAQYGLQLLCYGRNAILGALTTNGTTPHEVGVMMRVRAADQATATAIAKTANPLLLHLTLSGMEHLPSFAFATSPAEIERGVVYEFVLNHVVAVDDPTDLFRTTIGPVRGG